MELKVIQDRIYVIRGERIMLDFDLAELYEVETRVLKQAVRRNINRFPEDFMFQLTEKEITKLVSQFVIPSKSKLGGALPFAFTEQGVSMLSSVLSSKKAIEVNISIIRAFVLLRRYMEDYKDLKSKIAELELEMNTNFKDINQALHYLLAKDQLKVNQNCRKRIGYRNAP